MSQAVFGDVKDALGFGSLTEEQLRPMVAMLKRTRRLECDPPACEGSGIVICGGGKYEGWAWCTAKHLRNLGCRLPIQIWHLGFAEITRRPKFSEVGAELVDAFEVQRNHPYRTLTGWTAKNYAIRHCPWRRVLFLDADSFAAHNPEEMFAAVPGSLFFSDLNGPGKPNSYLHCGLRVPALELESGQYLVDKASGWMTLRWAMWMNEHADLFYRLGYGDRHTLTLATMLSGCPAEVSTERSWDGWGLSQKWRGKERFRHCIGVKRGESEVPAWLAELFSDWRR